MVHISRFSDYKKTKSLFLREHERIIKKYHVEFISIKGVKMPLICLYDIVLSLFENNSIFLKTSDIIILTLCSLGILSKENEDTVKILIKACKEKNIFRELVVVKNTLNGLKNLTNIVLKNDFVVKQNIEQALKYKYSMEVFSLILNFIRDNGIKIKEFSIWYITDQRNSSSKELIDYLISNYYL